MSATRSYLGIGIGLAVVGAVVWFGLAGRPQPAAAATIAAPVLTVSVVAAHKRAVDDAIAVVGATVPRENVMVVPELAGQQVREIHADVGDYVRKGQLLAVLDSSNLSIQSAGLRSEYERTRGEYERVQSLQPSGAVSREFVAQKNAAYQVALANLRNAELSVRRARIVAPTDGLIYERSAAIGGLTSFSEPLFKLAKDGLVEMEANVPERQVARLRVGLPASLRLAGESAPIQGEIRLIAPRVDSASRSASVRIALQRPGESAHRAAVGMFCEAGITVAQVEGWVLPGSALQQDAAGAFVWSVRGGNAVRRLPVEVVARTPEHVVVAAIDAGERIVAKAGPFLRDGDIVALTQARR
ncbi:efflux RND transporter periplasmic adaptor subunit [Lysobacter enzymogenes]|uniref:efflux RND transporter periplasmic adaptor subunit n=1 Tax=Lysobacter enzymogenes TaxID=69 RepID=UPI001AF47A82|nr:efflux RND transporter periplasmic adaptor subunit [Lysobacter enzymogenes]QQP99367.1 efflux RND transporter periplasmic adaptor subunit [Lysobacter enzymogenes]